MIRNLINRCLFLNIFLMCLLPGAPIHATEITGDTFSEKYKIIAERNIFSRSRTPQIAIGTQGDTGEQEKDPVEVKTILYVLRGITIDNQDRRLFIENELTGQSFQLSVGEEFDGVIAKEIQSNYAVIQVAGEDVQVKVGSDLTGRQANAEIAHAPSSPNTPSDIKKSETLSNEKENEILRQLMERRKREMGGEQ